MPRRRTSGNSEGEILEKRASGDLQDFTDWARVDALTDADIEAAMRADPDWQHDLDLDWENAVLVVPPSKTPISIRLDDDVLAFFREGGAGYQKRINAVLRSYMDHTLKRRSKRKPNAAE